MSLLTYERTPIVVPVAPYVQNAETLFLQRAEFTGMTVSITAGELSLVLHTVAHKFTLAGEPIPPGAGLQPVPVPLTADNNWAVYFNPANQTDPRNGQPLYKRGGVGNADWYAPQPDGTFTLMPNGLSSAPEPLRLQGDWAETILLSLLGGLIRSNIQAANLPPFNRYA